MRLKRETEVAIAILVACARSGDCRLKTAEAAKAADTSTDFAAHIALRLVNAGLLVAKRGRTGGLMLSRPAQDIALGEVIGMCDDQSKLAQDHSGSISGSAPSLEQIIAGANHAMRSYLDRFSIADLADRNRSKSSKSKAGLERGEAFLSAPRPIGLGF